MKKSMKIADSKVQEYSDALVHLDLYTEEHRTTIASWYHQITKTTGRTNGHGRKWIGAGMGWICGVNGNSPAIRSWVIRFFFDSTVITYLPLFTFALALSLPPVCSSPPSLDTHSPRRMGHTSFHSHKGAKQAKRKGAYALPPAAQVFIDASFILHLINSRNKGLALGVAKVYKGSPDSDRLVAAYADALVGLAGPYASVATWVFEAQRLEAKRCDEKKRVRRKKSMKIGTGRLYSARHSIRREGRKMVAFSMGRPKNWFIGEVIKVLKRRNMKV